MEPEKLNACPVCTNQSFSPHISVEDHTVSHGTFEIVRCCKCGFLFTNPRPSPDAIGAFYESSEYISHHDTSDTLFSKVYNYVRDIAIRQKISLVEKYTSASSKTILDIGCGTGAFLTACKQVGWEVYGTEPDSDARQAAIVKTGTGIFEDIAHPELQKPYTAITLWHVLEHVHQLNETMHWIETHLDPKGALFIAVPNPESYDAKRYRKYWAAYDVPRHLYHFTKATMEKLLLKHHLQVVEIKNMLFDSYYVSMLSSRYKNGRTNFLESFLTGTLSNLKGCGSNDKTVNTSSLIYIVKKK